MRFLPWVRRGLAAEIATVDDGGSLPLRGRLPVTVTVNAATAAADVTTYGPGDVTGLDGDSIVRIAPRRFAMNVAPDEFAVVEFDPPDLPWMFTPARANSDNRLRPWLVLIVVRAGEGVGITFGGDTPLPKLTIQAPTLPASELPDLADSWAWAHAQVITAGSTGSTADALADSPAHNISRVVCPRRLEPNVRYYAALVPAFDAGVAAGLGEPPDQNGATLGPAWDVAALGDRIVLPTYYHWEFTTGPAGDFELLAQKLRPASLPAGVGTAPMFIGAADPALPALTADAGGVISMEGALRAPEAGAGAVLDARHKSWVDQLVQLVDDNAAAVTGGTAQDAEAVGPPVYGSWHSGSHRVPPRGGRPRWLRDLNVDPRHRAAAGLGAEVVRANQEEYVDAAWSQVGDVLGANRLIDLSRAMVQVAERIHRRHIGPLDALTALELTRSAHSRIVVDDMVLYRLVAESATPRGFTARSFQRLASPRNAYLRHATSRAVRAGGPAVTADPAMNADLTGMVEATAGVLDPSLSVRPDGIVGSRLPALADQYGAVLTAVQRQVVVEFAGSLRQRTEELARAGTAPPRLRGDLGRTGVVDDHHVLGLRAAAQPTADLRVNLHAFRQAMGSDASVLDESVVGVALVGDRALPMTVDTAGRVTVRVGSHTATMLSVPVRGPAQLEPDLVRDQIRRLPDAIGPVPGSGVGVPPRGSVASAGSLPSGAPRPRPGARPLVDSSLQPVLEQMNDDAILEAITGLAGDALHVTAPVVTIARPMVEALRVTAFSRAFDAMLMASPTTVITDLAPPPALDLETVHSALVSTTQPRPVVEARVADRIRADGLRLADVQPHSIELFQPDPVAPVMVGPVLDRPLYLDLAQFDQARFLPGGGAVPENSITLLETNPRFVEAFLVGANHEMSRELLWRRYPTDRRATVFRKFWERIDDGSDIAPIHTWQTADALGSHSGGAAGGRLVLLIRGQLLRRYPGTVVYAVAATEQRRIDGGATPLLPVFAGFLDPDITFVGFDLDVETATAGYGTMFVLQEQPSEPRFGLDVSASAAHPAIPPAWSDLTWGHVGVAPGGFLDTGVFGSRPSRPLVPDSTAVKAQFGADAAQMAAITYQRPFQVAVHSSLILR